MVDIDTWASSKRKLSTTCLHVLGIQATLEFEKEIIFLPSQNCEKLILVFSFEGVINIFSILQISTMDRLSNKKELYRLK